MTPLFLWGALGVALILFFKAVLRGQPGLMLRRTTDLRGRATSRWMREYPTKLSPPKSISGNISRGRAAMTHVLIHREDAISAMFRPDLGWIDFLWGSDGGPVLKSGKRKGAHGVSHILEARQRKDGMAKKQAYRLAMFLPEILARGRNVTPPGFHGNARIEFAGHSAVLVASPERHHWLLTGWKNAPRQTKEGL